MFLESLFLVLNFTILFLFLQQEVDESDNISKKISVPELFAQLKITEVELENLKVKIIGLYDTLIRSLKGPTFC